MIDKLDTSAHIASCSRREDGTMNVRRSARDFPIDTFAGGSQLLLVVANLRDGRQKIDFHAFACIPGPRVFQIDAIVPASPQRWPLYPGEYASPCARTLAPASISL
jgi:hypothetical protein